MIRPIFAALLFPVCLMAQAVVYTHPGIVQLSGDRWEGSDHLLNLNGPINVIVEILKPKDKDIPLTVESIEKRVNEAFQKADIKTGVDLSSATPGVPFFNVLIIAYPVEKGFAAVVEVRLMEVVNPYRIKLDKDTFFQAVTWEKKSLLVAPTNEFRETVDKTIDELVKTFIERDSYFKAVRTKLQNKDAVEKLE
jgi:hypothetical protein